MMKRAVPNSLSQYGVSAALLVQGLAKFQSKLARDVASVTRRDDSRDEWQEANRGVLVFIRSF